MNVNTVCLVMGIVCWLTLGCLGFLKGLKVYCGSPSLSSLDLLVSSLVSIFGPTVVLLFGLDFLLARLEKWF